MSEEKREGAMRLFEALSGVEQGLLERSERPQKRKSFFTFPTWYGGRILAAAFAFAVLGTVVWGAGTVMFRSGTSSDSSMFTVRNGKIESAEDSVQENALESAAAGAAAEGRPETEAAQAAEDAPISDTQKQTELEVMQEGGYENAELSETEARGFEVLGDYVPETVPKGYVFETARGGSRGEQKNLYVSWNRGMDYISLTVENVVETESLAFTDIGRPETYDVNRYDIPYAETVPKEYWDSFDNPIFKSTELTLELIGSRMKIYEDAGDTSTPRGNFAVYFEKENVLVCFNGKGTAEEIMKMFESMKPYAQ